MSTAKVHAENAEKSAHTAHPKSKTAESNEICIANGASDPTDVSIKAGGTVCWKNDDTTPHSLVFTSPPPTKPREFDPKTLGVGGASSVPPVSAPANCPESGSIAPGATLERVFTTAGTFPYHCTDNPEIHGTVNVA